MARDREIEKREGGVGGGGEGERRGRRMEDKYWDRDAGRM